MRRGAAPLALESARSYLRDKLRMREAARAFLREDLNDSGHRPCAIERGGLRTSRDLDVIDGVGIDLRQRVGVRHLHAVHVHLGWCIGIALIEVEPTAK